MGLRLYQAPVESDIQSKAATDKNTAQGRSPIRRAALRRNPEQIRERRRRQLAAVATYGTVSFEPSSLSPPPLPESSTPREAPVRPSIGADGDNATERQRDASRQALRDVASRLNGLDDRLVARYSERWAQLHADSNPSPARNSSGGSWERMAIDALSSEPYTVSYMRSTGENRSYTPPTLPEISRSTRLDEEIEYVRASTSRRRADVARMRDLRDQIARRQRGPRTYLNILDSPEPADNGSEVEVEVHVENRSEAGSRLDGLGDRNRSLSPDGDHVWDTLLTTITPDPQPPSVGSSFASTSASTAASSSNGPAGSGSSRTSLPDPDTELDLVEIAPGVTLEQPCESGCEGTDTEGDDEEETVLTLQRFPSSSRRRSRSRNNAERTDDREGSRSYADVARSVTNSSEESGEYLGDMQRIVRNLARREDIPEEWWAQVGLSRTLSREASTA